MGLHRLSGVYYDYQLFRAGHVTWAQDEPTSYSVEPEYQIAPAFRFAYTYTSCLYNDFHIRF